MGDIEFEWDSGKAITNLRKHGVSFEEAASVFSDPGARAVYDESHSAGEDRWEAIGLSEKLRVLSVVYTRRGDAIRIVSASKVTAREMQEYGET